MFFHSIPSIFLLIPICIIFSFVLFSRSQTAHKYFLLCFSLLFYGFDHFWFIIPLLISACVDYSISRQLVLSSLSKHIRFVLLLSSVVVNLTLLCIFKYSPFIEQTFSVLPHFDLNLPSFLLPAGISFYTFQTLSFTADSFRRKNIQVPPFSSYLLFVCYFPQLVAGPILRFSDFFGEKASLLFYPTAQRVLRGYYRFVCGLALKLLFADELARLNDIAYAADYSSLGFLDAWTMAIGFGLQIYFDFAAYSHMAIGISLMLGLKIMENFNFPYLATTPSVFWRRWHISLSLWIKDYLYSILNYKLPSFLVGFLPLCITWSVMGLWHGPSWMFVFWGFLNSLIILVYRLLKVKFHRVDTPINYTFMILGWLITMLSIMSTWLFFRSDNWNQATHLYSLLCMPSFSGFALGLRENYYLFVFVFFVCTIIFGLLSQAKFVKNLLSRSLLLSPIITLMLSLSLLFLNRQQSFIYFAF